MKKLSDYKGEASIELWADLLEPIGDILADKELMNVLKKPKLNKLQIAGEILKRHSAEAERILLRIDPEPINGLTVAIRVVALLNEFENCEELKDFFAVPQTETSDTGSFGSATASTEESVI